jgi:maltoporin
VEAGTTARDADAGQPRQVLNKLTVAPTLAVGPELRSRPELRFYVTYASWNDAAAQANLGKPGDIGFASTDGVAANLRHQTLIGVQFEASF